MPSSASPLDSLLALSALGRTPRAGWLQAGMPVSESVAAHSLGAAFLALALGPRVVPPLDVDRAAALLVAHDAPEALLGDLPRRAQELLPAGAKAHAEERAAAEVLGTLSELALARFREYSARETREARFARLCDKLQLGVQLVLLARAGLRLPPGFRATLAAVDSAEFPACAELQAEILAALDAHAPAGGASP
jgi:putative hydrolase of HD superfamily